MKVKKNQECTQKIMKIRKKSTNKKVKNHKELQLQKVKTPQKNLKNHTRH